MSMIKLLQRMGISPRDFLLWVPDSNTKTLEEILTEPLDAIYVTRPQVERWADDELRRNSNLGTAREELAKRQKQRKGVKNG